MNVCVFSSSSDRIAAEFHEPARETGRLLAQAGHHLVYGGVARGLMGIVADGARSAGGHVIGIIPRFMIPHGIADDECHELCEVETMAERKRLMFDRSDAFVCLPGGVGTLEELFEIVTLIQLGERPRPVVMINTSRYYEPLLGFISAMEQKGFARNLLGHILRVARGPVEAMVEIARPAQGPGSTKWDTSTGRER